jgi:hypothetical protein
LFWRLTRKLMTAQLISGEFAFPLVSWIWAVTFRRILFDRLPQRSLVVLIVYVISVRFLRQVECEVESQIVSSFCHLLFVTLASVLNIVAQNLIFAGRIEKSPTTIRYFKNVHFLVYLISKITGLTCGSNSSEQCLLALPVCQWYD